MTGINIPRTNCIQLHISTNEVGVKEVFASFVDVQGDASADSVILDSSLFFETDGDIYIKVDDVFNAYLDVACIVGMSPMYFELSNSQTDAGTFKFYDDDAVMAYFGIEVTPPVSSVQSLNGDYDSFLDGSDVLCFPANRPYKVVRSYLSFSSKSNLTIIYDLIDDAGKKHTAPHDALTLKV